MSTPERTLYIRGEALAALVATLGPMTAKALASIVDASEEAVTSSAMEMVRAGYLHYDGISYRLTGDRESEP